MPGSLLQVENLTIRRDDGTGSAVLHVSKVVHGQHWHDRIRHSPKYTGLTRYFLLMHQDLSLKLDENEVLIVKGRSGSGKSTLLKCIAQLNVYEAGQTTLHGK